MRVDGPSSTELYPNRRVELGRLAERLREVERRAVTVHAAVRLPWVSPRVSPKVSPKVGPGEEARPGGSGLALEGEVGTVGVGAVHEWVGLMERAAPPLSPHPHTHTPPSNHPPGLQPPPAAPVSPGGRGARPMLAGAWVPPVTVLAHVAAAAVQTLGRVTQGGGQGGGPVGGPGGGSGGECGGGAVAVWIGARVWPTWAVWREAAEGAGVSAPRHILVDPPDEESRVWAIDLALRCPGTVVVADASGLERGSRASSSRRFQLAAEASGSIALLAHPPDADARVSFAATRWTVTPEVSPAGNARWVVGLVRRKGLPAMDSPRWTVERVRGGLVDADSLLAGVPEVADGRGPSRAAS